MDSLQYTNSNVKSFHLGYANLLSRYQFTWFTTLTFKGSPCTYKAVNHFKRFIKYIQRNEKVNIGYYVGLELSEQGLPHFHSLMGNLEGVRRDKWWKWWFTRYGAARILPYDPAKGASHYVAKYVTKRLAWYEVKALDKLNLYPILN